MLPLLFPDTSPVLGQRGAVFTKPWVVSLILDLAGYVQDANLVDVFAIEPAAGEGAFLTLMAQRLVRSCLRQGRPLSDCRDSLVAYEIHETAAQAAQEAVVSSLGSVGVTATDARLLASTWVRTGDFLLEVSLLPAADFVVGNPPYVRIEAISADVSSLYRRLYPTMRGRADLYVGFLEASLRRLRENGVCAFICADRWMLNQYGADLRQMITRSFSVESVIEMHRADPFTSVVDAYPAVTIIRRGIQGKAVVASLGPAPDHVDASAIVASLASGAPPVKPIEAKTTLASWFAGLEPWPCSSPGRLALLRRLEEQFQVLECPGTGTRVGIGVATGCDDVFITTDPDLVEESRLLPLALSSDTRSGALRWSGHYLVDPWDANGLVDLGSFPRLQAHFDIHRSRVQGRHTARQNPLGWYRTIDRVSHALLHKPKLYIADIKETLNPVLDNGGTYPHHNLYFVESAGWDLEVLGGLLLSSVAQLFIEAYGVRMAGGFLRCQAQYLRRLRVPRPEDIEPEHTRQLIRAFRTRDRALASSVAVHIYQINTSEMKVRAEC